MLALSEGTGRTTTCNRDQITRISPSNTPITLTGRADDEYFNHGRKRRHVLVRNTVVQLICGAQFNGQQVHLDLPHLQIYSRTVEHVLKRFA
jgi:hypothetical protein